MKDELADIEGQIKDNENLIRNENEPKVILARKQTLSHLYEKRDMIRGLIARVEARINAQTVVPQTNYFTGSEQQNSATPTNTSNPTTGIANNSFITEAQDSSLPSTSRIVTTGRTQAPVSTNAQIDMTTGRPVTTAQVINQTSGGNMIANALQAKAVRDAERQRKNAAQAQQVEGATPDRDTSLPSYLDSLYQEAEKGGFAPETADTEEDPDYNNALNALFTDEINDIAGNNSTEGTTLPDGRGYVGRQAKLRAQDLDTTCHYAVVEADDLKEDPNNSRARGERAASDDQIRSIADNLNPDLLIDNSIMANDGPIVIGEDMIVESGNGRMKAIQMAYADQSGEGEYSGSINNHQYGKASQYRNAIVRRAAEFGISPKQVASMKHPVLVRIRDNSNISRQEFGIKSNTSRQMAMSATEQALVDAEKIKPYLFKFKAVSDIDADSNREFVRDFLGKVCSPGELNDMYTKDRKMLSANGRQRIMNALFAVAFRNSEVLSSLTEYQIPEVQTILNGIIGSIGDAIKLKGEAQQNKYFDIDFSDDLASAIMTIRDIKLNADLSNQASNSSLAETYFRQSQFADDGKTPEARLLIGVLGNLRSKEAITEFMRDCYAEVRAHGDPNQRTLDGSLPALSNLEVIEGAIRRSGIAYKDGTLLADDIERFKKGPSSLMSQEEWNNLKFSLRDKNDYEKIASSKQIAEQEYLEAKGIEEDIDRQIEESTGLAIDSYNEGNQQDADDYSEYTKDLYRQSREAASRRRKAELKNNQTPTVEQQQKIDDEYERGLRESEDLASLIDQLDETDTDTKDNNTTNTTNTTIKREELDAVVYEYNRNLASDTDIYIEVYDSPQEYNRENGLSEEKAVPSNAEGMNDEGHVVLFRNNIRDIKHARRKLLHEVIGHTGIKKLLGVNYRYALDGLVDLAKRDKNVRKLFKTIANIYQPYIDGQKNPQSKRDYIFEEVGAFLAEKHDDQRGIVRRFLDRIRLWCRNTLRNYGFNIKADNLELTELFNRSQDIMTESGKWKQDYGATAAQIYQKGDRRFTDNDYNPSKDNNGVRYSDKDEYQQFYDDLTGNSRLSDDDSNKYDYHNTSFFDQLRDFYKGKLKSKSLYVGKSPKVLNDIDIDLPMVINPSHVEMALEGKYHGKSLTQQDKDDHVFAPQDFALLPQKIANPIAIIHERKYDKNTQKYIVSADTIDILVEMTVKSGKQVIVPISVSNEKMNGKFITSLKLKSVHGNSNAINRLVYALQNDTKQENMLFYVNKQKTINVLQSVLPKLYRNNTLIPDGSIHKVTDSGSPVKNKFSNINRKENYIFSLSDSDEMDQFYNDLTGDMPGTESDPFEDFDRNMSELGEPSDKTQKKFSLAGINAETADIAKLEKARNLLADGMDRKEVWKKTGWYKGKDGKFRFEISDLNLKLKDQFRKIKRDLDKKSGVWIVKLGEIISHQKLFKAYPEMRILNVAITNEPDSTYGGRYTYKEYSDGLREHELHLNLGKDYNKTYAGIKETITHEIQHYIQQIEGFAKGSTVGEELELLHNRYSPNVILSKLNGPGKELAKKYMEVVREQNKYDWNNDETYYNHEALKVIDEITDIQHRFAREQMLELAKEKPEILDDPDYFEKNLTELCEPLRNLEKGMDIEAKNDFPDSSHINEARENYRKQYGETEARAVGKRSGYWDNKNLPYPEDDFDVSAEDTNVRLSLGRNGRSDNEYKQLLLDFENGYNTRGTQRGRQLEFDFDGQNTDDEYNNLYNQLIEDTAEQTDYYDDTASDGRENIDFSSRVLALIPDIQEDINEYEENLVGYEELPAGLEAYRNIFDGEEIADIDSALMENDYQTALNKLMRIRNKCAKTFYPPLADRLVRSMNAAINAVRTGEIPDVPDNFTFYDFADVQVRRLPHSAEEEKDWRMTGAAYRHNRRYTEPTKSDNRRRADDARYIREQYDNGEISEEERRSRQQKLRKEVKREWDSDKWDYKETSYDPYNGSTPEPVEDEYTRMRHNMSERSNSYEDFMLRYPDYAPSRENAGKETNNDRRKRYGSADRFKPRWSLGGEELKSDSPRIFVERNGDKSIELVDSKVEDLVDRNKITVITQDDVDEIIKSWGNPANNKRSFLKQLLKKVLQDDNDIEFEFGNKTIHAYLTQEGRGHFARFNTKTPSTGALAVKFKEIARNSEYVYSTENESHKNNYAEQVEGWDNFVSVVNIAGETYRILFGLRKTMNEKRHQIYSINKTGEDNIHTMQTSENRSHHELRVLPSSPNLSVTENSDPGKSNDEIPESPQINYSLSDQNNKDVRWSLGDNGTADTDIDSVEDGSADVDKEAELDKALDRRFGKFITPEQRQALHDMGFDYQDVDEPIPTPKEEFKSQLSELATAVEESFEGFLGDTRSVKDRQKPDYLWHRQKQGDHIETEFEMTRRNNIEKAMKARSEEDRLILQHLDADKNYLVQFIRDHTKPGALQDWLLKKTARILGPFQAMKPIENILYTICENLMWDEQKQKMVIAPQRIWFEDKEHGIAEYRYEANDNIGRQALKYYNKLNPEFRAIVEERAKVNNEFRKDFCERVKPLEKAKLLLAIFARRKLNGAGEKILEGSSRIAHAAVSSLQGIVDRVDYNALMSDLDYITNIPEAYIGRNADNINKIIANLTGTQSISIGGLQKKLEILSSNNGIYGYVHHHMLLDPETKSGGKFNALGKLGHPWLEVMAADRKARKGDGGQKSLLLADVARNEKEATAEAANRWMADAEDQRGIPVEAVSEKNPLPGGYKKEQKVIANFGKWRGKEIYLPDELFDTYQLIRKKGDLTAGMEPFSDALKFIDNANSQINQALLYAPAKAARDLIAVPFALTEFLRDWSIKHPNEAVDALKAVWQGIRNSASPEYWQSHTPESMGEYSESLTYDRHADHSRSVKFANAIGNIFQKSVPVGSTLAAMLGELNLSGAADIPLKRILTTVGETLADKRGLKGNDRLTMSQILTIVKLNAPLSVA